MSKPGFGICADVINTDEWTTRCGTHFTFENGWTLSIQWSPLNYCEAKNHFDRFDGQSATAECAAWDAKGNSLRLSDNDDVRGWMSPHEVVDLLVRVRQMPKAKEDLTDDS